MTEFKEINQDPTKEEGQLDNENSSTKTYTEEEYKNLQAFGTKAQQQMLNTSKKLVEKDPNELLGMDAQIQKKVIKDVWGYDNLDELKVMMPEVFNSKEEDNNDLDYGNNDEAYNKLKREQELLKMKLSKKEIEDEIEKFTFSHKDIVSSIPNFDEKIRDELKYISSELPIKERVDRATKLVSGNSNLDIDAYLQLQGKTKIKSSQSKMTDDYVLSAQNQLRQQLGLKTK